MREAADDLRSSSWTVDEAEAALEALGRMSGLPLRRPGDPPLVRGGSLGARIRGAAGRLGIHVEEASSSYGEVDKLLRSAGPALLRCTFENEMRLLALLPGGGRRALRVLAPDGKARRADPRAVRAALATSHQEKLGPEIDRMLEDAGVPERRRRTAREALLRDRLGARPVAACWLVSAAPGGSPFVLARSARLPTYVLGLAAAHALHFTLWVASWWVIGRGALEGRLDVGWLGAWALLLMSLVPLRMLVTWLQGRLAVRAGSLLKQRLFYGALRLHPDETRHQGVGQLLGRVIDSEAMESLAVNGGILGIMGLVELTLSFVVLGWGAAPRLHPILLALWLAAVFSVLRIYLRRAERWADERREMTHDLVERMTGHRTRLAQESRDAWHDDEDRLLSAYLEVTREMDRTGARLLGAAPRGWLVLGVLALVPAFLAARFDPVRLAVGLGGVLLAYRALARFVPGALQVAAAIVSWKQAAPLFHAAARGEREGVADLPVSSDAREPILRAEGVVFRYPRRSAPVLNGVGFTLSCGDRLLVEGPSGGGKSTLASLLIGLRSPDAGLLLLHGLDPESWGSEEWRSRIAAAPQFQENYVFTESFAFNLLMGRRWPPQPEDLEEAEEVCRELGLGDLLERMPAGLDQLVGESGWQLSHGETTRLFIARALLQKADLVILDESFAALDPDNLLRAVDCTLRRTPSLMVIAHP